MTTTWSVYPSMTKADMDKFLESAFAVKDNQYSVEELFDAAQDAVACLASSAQGARSRQATELPRGTVWGKGKYVSARPGGRSWPAGVSM